MTDEQATPPPETRSAPPAPIRRLTRRSDHKVIAGVASGLGDYFGIDPVIFRIGFIVLTLSGGIGLLLYAIAWWAVPRADDPEAGNKLAHRLHGLPPWVGIAALIVGVALVAGQIGAWQPSIAWGIALIGVGILLFRQESVARSTPAPSSPSGVGGGGPSAGALDAFSVAPPSSTQVPPGAATQHPPVLSTEGERVPKQRSPLGGFTIAAALLATGIAALMDEAGWVHLTLVQFLALPMLVIGAGLLVGVRWGRARWLLVFGVLLVPFLFTASLIHVPFRGGSGDRLVRPTSLGELRPEYRMVAGRMVIDLGHLPFSPSVTSHITASVVAGEVSIVVPQGVRVIGHAHVGAGTIDLLGDDQNGVSIDALRTVGPVRPAGTVDLDVQAGLGHVSVYREVVRGVRP